MTTIDEAVQIAEILRYYFGEDITPNGLDRRLSKLTGKFSLTRVKHDAEKQENLFNAK